MKFFVGAFLLVCVWMALPTSSVAVSNEEKYYDREVIHQVANWLVQAVRNTEANICSSGAMSSQHKRNSEIINSILGLPKNLNDVGRK